MSLKAGGLSASSSSTRQIITHDLVVGRAPVRIPLLALFNPKLGLLEIVRVEFDADVAPLGFNSRCNWLKKSHHIAMLRIVPVGVSLNEIFPKPKRFLCGMNRGLIVGDRAERYGGYRRFVSIMLGLSALP